MNIRFVPVWQTTICLFTAYTGDTQASAAQEAFESVNTNLKKGDLDRAIADFDRASELDPNLSESYVDRGNFYDAQGDYSLALTDYDSAIELCPDDSIPLLGLLNNIPILAGQ